MISKAETVPGYIAELTADRRKVLEKLRGLCGKHLAGYEECMAHGMPAYKRDGQMEISFASQKQYVAVYVMNGPVLDEFRSELAGADIGKSCIRFRNPEKINFEVLTRLLKKTRGSARP